MNKGEAMRISGSNSWVMLGMNASNDGSQEEFAGTCLSDPSLCEDGVTIGLWFLLGKLYYINSSLNNLRYCLVFLMLYVMSCRVFELKRIDISSRCADYCKRTLYNAEFRRRR